MSNLNASLKTTAVSGITKKHVDDQHQIIPVLELMIGINYETYFYRNNYHFDISAAYELQYYWSQNYLRYVFALDRSFNDLNFHGLNITARFDF